MAVRGFFYNSVNKDRLYNGQDMNEDKAPFYKEGVAYGHLQVTADGESMAVKVDGGSRTGYAYINLHTIHNTTVLELPVSGSNGTLPRIDRVILRNDETERKPSIFILEGAYSSNPQPPELTNNDTIQEKCLAEIYVAAGAVAISQSDITDTRADTGLCGFIASQFEDFDFSQFTKQFNAWFALEKKSMEQDHANFIEEYAEMTQAFMTDQEAQWNKWFKEKQTELSGDIAGKLQLQIDDVKEKVYNIAFKVYIISTLEQITSPVRMYAFKGDISKYFASIPHDKLKDENRRYIGDKKALMLMDDIIDHNGILPDGVGIPVGNLTSQLFANVYGNKLDKFCKHVLHIPYFVRYMDDFIILSDDLEQLKEWVKRIEEFLENEMLLHINPKSTILYAGNGIDFCGYIHYADHKKVRKSSIRKLKQDVKAYELGELPPEEFNRKYESRKGHLGHADTYHIAKAVEYELLFYEWERLEATA